MKTFSDDPAEWRLKTELQRSIVFTVLAAAIFGVLLLADRRSWAEPWLLASVFTFAVWRMNRPTAS